MPLRLALAAVLGFLTFLPSVMLGLGQGDAFLPVLLAIGAITSFVLTDYRRVIQLGNWTVNVLVILIFSFNIIEVLRHRGEDLAMSIAQTLVFVQIVLLFREKTPRFCWQILLISLCQVVAATAFQQSIMFGLLLLLYVSVGLLVFILLFLQQEHQYFRRHSFIKTFMESVKSELAERQDHRKLVRIALTTLFMGPLSLVISFNKKNSSLKQSESEGEKETAEDATRKILRTFFQVFPEEDLSQDERWENVEVSPEDAVSLHHTLDSSFHFVPAKDDTEQSFSFRRFPLLTERPSFSAGTRYPQQRCDHWHELLFHLAKGMVFAFILAVVIFCLLPRVGQVELYGFSLKPGYANWGQPVRQSVNVGTVGINEEIQLGSLGAVIAHHKEVIKVQLYHNSGQNNASTLSYEVLPKSPYLASIGAALYFRGIPLDTYARGTWTQSVTFLHRENEPGEQEYREDEGDTNSLPVMFQAFDYDLFQIGAALHRQGYDNVIFEENSDLVMLEMTIQPMNTQVFFAPHPFFTLRKEGDIRLISHNGRVDEMRWRWRERSIAVISPSFKKGTQLDLTPCQERIELDKLLLIPDRGLDALKKLAAQWDKESGLEQDDVVGRARFLEQKFIQSAEFSYQLGGVVRHRHLDPLEDFIAHNPRGHCEYFAGALAMMLRSVGIASRVIIGFKTEVVESNASCTIRQSDAHSWVEVYVPPEVLPPSASAPRTSGQYAPWWQNGAWLRLDPTPSQTASAMQSLTFRWTDWSQAVQSFWDNYVLNMTSNRQGDLIYTPLLQTGRFFVQHVFNLRFWQDFGTDMLRYYQSFFSDAPKPERRMWDGYYLMAPFVLLGLIGIASWRLFSMLWTIRKRSGEEMRRKITVEFYIRMERILAQIDIHRLPAVTPLEFARQTAFTPLMLPIVDAFYRVRFGNAVLSEEESHAILRTLEKLESAVIQRNKPCQATNSA